MKCLTPEKTLTGDCEFLAANLYAKSMFGESALANLSIEVGHNGFVQGKTTFSIFDKNLYLKYFRTYSDTCKKSRNGNLFRRQN